MNIEARPASRALSALTPALDRARQVAASPWPWLVLLIVIAAAYYGSYWRHSINFRDESGTVTFIAERLVAGERPFVDRVLGYNVLWFYPVAGLFKLFGTSYVLARAYFLALSAAAAVFSFLVVHRASGRPWAAFLAGLICVVVPGMTFKNYIPFLVLANSFALVHFVLGAKTRWRWLVAGGVILGITFLTRVDLGVFTSVLWLGALLLIAFDGDPSRAQRLRLALAGPVVLAGLVWTVHLPIYLDARARGFDGAFVGQYLSWPIKIGHNLQQLLEKKAAPVPAPALPAPKEATQKDASTVVPAAAPAPLATAPPPTKSSHIGALQRPGWSQIVGGKDAEAKVLAALLYAPLIALAPLVALALFGMCRAITRRDPETLRRRLASLLLLGCALTAFPQYFFFRADAPHLSEFSPGFWTAVIASFFLFRWDQLPALRTWAVRLFLLFFTIHLSFYLWRMLPDRWTGTIAARKGRTQLFEAHNGVSVYVSKRELTGLKQLAKVIEDFSDPGDWLAAYPYHPTINVLADRPTYEKNVYVDNATRPRNWDAEAIARFEKFQPAVVVISEWDVNGTDESRFGHWAVKTKTWLQTHYTYQGTYLDFEVFTRRPTP